MSTDRILVTGASGFIGERVVFSLLERGHTNLRLFVRPSSRLDRLNATLQRYGARDSVEIVSGDLLSRDDSFRAAQGVAIIAHLAAGFDKSFPGAFMNSALATRNLVESFLERGHPIRFVNVSSFSVYSNLHLGRGELLDENCPLETAPQARGDPYAFGKLKQEHIVRKYGESHSLPYVVLRPGAVFGPGKPIPSGRIGINTFGPFLHLGGSNRIPLTYVDNCADAIVLAALTSGVERETFNVVDDDLPTSREFLRAYKHANPKMRTVPVPRTLTRLFCTAWEAYSIRSAGQLPPVFNRRRWSAEWKGNQYSNRKLKERLGWRPKVSMDQAMAQYLKQFEVVSPLSIL